MVPTLPYDREQDSEDTISDEPRTSTGRESPSKRPRGRPKKNRPVSTSNMNTDTPHMELEDLFGMELDFQHLSRDKAEVGRTLLNGLNRGVFSAEALIQYFLGGSQPVYNNMNMREYEKSFSKSCYLTVTPEDYMLPENVKHLLSFEKIGLLSSCGKQVRIELSYLSWCIAVIMSCYSHDMVY